MNVMNTYHSPLDEVVKSLREHQTTQPECDIVIPPLIPSRIIKMLGLAQGCITA